MGQGKEQGSQVGTLGTQGHVYTITPQTKPADQSIISGYVSTLVLIGKSIVRFCSICM